MRFHAAGAEPSWPLSNSASTLRGDPLPLEQREPKWWLAAETKIWSGNRLPTGKSRTINIGQLKNVASKARNHLNAILADWGGAGPAITDLVNSFPGGLGRPPA